MGVDITPFLMSIVKLIKGQVEDKTKYKLSNWTGVKLGSQYLASMSTGQNFHMLHKSISRRNRTQRYGMIKAGKVRKVDSKTFTST